MNAVRAEALAALSAAAYRTSSHSGATGSCVAVGAIPGWVGVQDSKQHPDSRQRTTLAFPRHRFTKFLSMVKTGRFDH